MSVRPGSVLLQNKHCIYQDGIWTDGFMSVYLSGGGLCLLAHLDPFSGLVKRGSTFFTLIDEAYQGHQDVLSLACAFLPLVKV